MDAKQVKNLEELLEQANTLKGELESLTVLDFEGLEDECPEVYHKAEALTYSTTLDDEIDSLINAINDAMPLWDDEDE